MRLLSAYEPARLAALERLDVVSGGREPHFDRLVELAQRCFGAPAAISFLDARRWWPKASAGLFTRPLPRGATFCDRVIDGDELLEVPDALVDARFSQLAIVQTGPRVRYYAGAPIKDPRGYGVGTFCIFDFRPRQLDEFDRLRLSGFARVTAALCELRVSRRTAREQHAEAARLDRMLALFQSVVSAVSEARDLPTALQLAAECIAAATGWRLRGVWRPGTRLDEELPARASLERRAVTSPAPAPTAAIPVLAGDEVVGVLTFEVDGRGDALPQVATVVQQVGAVVRRRRVEDALRASEQKLRSLTDTARDGIITVARDGTIVYANAAARALFGRDELRGLPLELLIPHWSDARDATAQGGPNMIERWAVHRSSRRFPVEISCAEWTQERSGYATAIVRDVTERHEARIAHEAAQQRLAFLFRATSELLEQPLSIDALLDTLTRLVLPHLSDWCIVDLVDLSPEGEPLRRGGLARGEAPSMSERLRRVACAPVDPAIGLAAPAGSDVAPPADALSGAAAAPSPDRAPLFAPEGDGSLVARVLAGGAPCLVSPETGGLLGAAGVRACVIVPLIARGHTIGAVSLISATRGYTSDDLALCTELAHRLALALDNAKLYDEARRAVRVRDDVLAIVSHDLRNPLTTILTSTERILNRDPEDARQSIERCRRAARRMTRMISDLVDAASLETGTLSLDQRPHEIARVVQDAVDLLQPLADPRAINLVVDGSPSGLWVDCDRERVVQVLSNLVGNAIKFAPTGSTIRINAESWGGMVRISVGDRGPGIAPELQSRIFDRYWHTGGENKKGAGLGLYISKGIVEGHGGRIWVDSTPGGGSTFYFTLPAADAKAIHVAN